MIDFFKPWFTQVWQQLRCPKDVLAGLHFFVQEGKEPQKLSNSLSDFQRELVKVIFHFRRLIPERALESDYFYK